MVREDDVELGGVAVEGEERFAGGWGSVGGG